MRKMNRIQASPVALLLATVIFISRAASADPCDFQSDYANGTVIFDHSRVMECFNSVPFNPADLENAQEVLEKTRNRSSLRSIYQQRYLWREALQDLGNQVFSNDFELQDALVRNHLSHKNGHYTYVPPRCYQNMLAAFIPLDFGSLVEKENQVIFIDGVLGLPQPVIDAYEAATGLSLADLVGLKVSKINGMDALEYFRKFGNSAQSWDENDGAVLNGILTDVKYAFRLFNSVIPTQSADILELESKSGRVKKTVTIPWQFLPLDLLQGDSPLTSGTEQFRDYCMEQNPLLSAVAGGSFARPSFESMGLRDPIKEEENERQMRREMARNIRFSDVPASAGGYYEVPAGQRNQYMTFLGSGPQIEAYEHMDSATIIRPFSFGGGDGTGWREELPEFTEYACQNSDRLIIDMTENGGGLIRSGDWLANHLFPAEPLARPHKSYFAALTDVDLNFDAFVLLPTLARDVLGIDLSVCSIVGNFVQSACYADASTGLPFTDVLWFFNARAEERGGVVEAVTPIIEFANYAEGEGFPWEVWNDPAPPIACPGKFSGENLIVVVDGTNASMGYFFPSMLKDKALLVALGGYVDEPVTLGQMRGGNVESVNRNSQLILFYLGLGVPMVSEPLLFNRNVDSGYEAFGIYRANQVDLHLVDPVEPDMVIRQWSSTSDPASRGYLFKTIITAVKGLSK
jgi:hypothetical protein